MFGTNDLGLRTCIHMVVRTIVKKINKERGWGRPQHRTLYRKQCKKRSEQDVVPSDNDIGIIGIPWYQHGRRLRHTRCLWAVWRSGLASSMTSSSSRAVPVCHREQRRWTSGQKIRLWRNARCQIYLRSVTNVRQIRMRQIHQSFHPASLSLIINLTAE